MTLRRILPPGVEREQDLAEVYIGSGIHDTLTDKVGVALSNINSMRQITSDFTKSNNASEYGGNLIEAVNLASQHYQKLPEEYRHNAEPNFDLYLIGVLLDSIQGNMGIVRQVFTIGDEGAIDLKGLPFHQAKSQILRLSQQFESRLNLSSTQLNDLGQRIAIIESDLHCIQQHTGAVYSLISPYAKSTDQKRQQT